MKLLKRLTTNQEGFTYLSLIIGMAILLMGLGFFTVLFKASRTSIIIAKEQMAMATVAQNVAQVYVATDDEDTAEDQGRSQGYPSVDLETSSGPEPGIKTVTITVDSKIVTSDPSDPKYVEPYVLVFYTPDIETGD